MSVCLSIRRRCVTARWPIRNVAGPLEAVVTILTTASALFSFDLRARGEDIQYNYSKCSRNPQGMIYVAAAAHVYRQPFENLTYVHGTSLESASGLPVPPRPFEPRGCPDHPLRGMGFKFDSFSDLTNPAAETATGGSVQLIEIDPASSWDTHERYSLSNSNACDAAKTREPQPIPGLTICSAGSTDWDDRPNRSGFVAIVDPQQYAGPLGQPLAVLCNPNMSAQADDYACEMSYRLGEDLSVWYQFRTSLLPLSGLIAFDRELRRRIAGAEVPNYWWPILPSGRPTAPK
jgi:hypothetical protein